MDVMDLYEQVESPDPEFPVYMGWHSPEEKEEYFPAHWHESLELHYILTGESVIYINQSPVIAKEGDLVICNSNELHQGFCSAAPMESCRLLFSLEDLSPEMDNRGYVFQNHIQKDEVIKQLFLELCREEANQAPGYKQACKAIVTQLMVHLCRNYVVQTLSREDTRRQKKNRERCNRLITFIEANYANPIANQDMADLVHLSKDRFEHFFRENFGLSALQYIQNYRMKMAKKLIKEGNIPISKVAEMVGFADYNYFGRTFRNHYGCTPTQMAKKYNSAIVR
jgi:AraC-like DNA-binding protein